MRNKRCRERGHYRGCIFSLSAVVVLACLASGLWAQEAPVEEGVVKESPEKRFRDRAHFRAKRTNWRNMNTPDEVRIFEGDAVFEVPYGRTTVTFKADKVAFEWAKEIVTATGNVMIEDGTSTIQSHLMVYDAGKRKAHFIGKAGQSLGVSLSQKLGNGETNSYETDWLKVTFGADGLEEVETGPGHGAFFLTGEEPLPIGPLSPSMPLDTGGPSELPRKVSPPPLVK